MKTKDGGFKTRCTTFLMLYASILLLLFVETFLALCFRMCFQTPSSFFIFCFPFKSMIFSAFLNVADPDHVFSVM